MYIFLDIFLTLVHLLVIGFNLTGWIWRRTRKPHHWVLGATAASWLVLGIPYGWGYCFLTDWQWQVKHRLGQTGLPASFIKYFADEVTGRNFDPQLIDALTAGVFFLIIILTLWKARR